MKIYVSCIVLCLNFLVLNGQNLTSNSTGSFTFSPEAPINRPDIEVYYHIPQGDIKTMPILFSFHGGSRDGANHRNYWIDMANANGFMVIAPEFSSQKYPGLGDNYIMSNIFDDGDNPSEATFNDKNEWTFSTIDPLFEYIKQDVSGSQETYKAWGHSAGAQFLHRFVMYLPNSKLDTAVCSNAGWYTVPENTVNFPYGTLNGQLPDEDLTTAFSKQLIVHLGLNDTDPNNSGLRHNTVVDAQQGLNRLVRGQYFFTTSQTTAQIMNVSFNWEKKEIANIGHDGQKMANDAVKYLFDDALTSDTIHQNIFISTYPNPTKNSFTFDNSKIKASTVDIYSVTGKKVQTVHFKTFKTNQEVSISWLSKGIYLLKVNQTTVKIIKS